MKKKIIGAIYVYYDRKGRYVIFLVGFYSNKTEEQEIGTVRYFMKDTCLVRLALIISRRIEKKTQVLNNFSAHFLLSLLLLSNRLTPFRETLHFI